MTGRFVGLLLLAVAVTTARAERVVEIKDAGQLRAASELLTQPTSRPAGRLVLRIAPGDYVLNESLRIRRSDVALLAGPGTRFRLAAGANQPVIAIGSQREIPFEDERIERIRIMGLVIDGNRGGQTSEVGRAQPWIRNNGIDVRMAAQVEIENVRISGCRSGGLVVSWKCVDVRVTDSVFTDSFFDGVAYYDSDRIETKRCLLTRNRGAGVSADNHFSRSRFVDCRIIENGDVGIFMRASRDILFDRCEISRNVSWGAFLAHDESDDGVHDVRFRRCLISNNRGGLRMASVNESQSRRTTVSRCVFAGNVADGRANVDSAGSLVRAKANRED